MSYILVSRNPRSGKLVIVTDDDRDDNVPAEFETYSDALNAANDTAICKAWGYRVLRVEEDEG